MVVGRLEPLPGPLPDFYIGGLLDALEVLAP